MFDAIRTRTLRILRVPHDPDSPAGAPGSVRVFRAGTNFYKLRLVRWGLGQVGALVGIIVSLTFLVNVEKGVEETRAQVRQAIAAKSAASATPALPASGDTQPPAGSTPDVQAEPSKAKPPKAKSKSRPGLKERARFGLDRFANRWPWWLFPALKFFEFAGILLYLVQIPITYALARLDYELRWYIVTDRSLRIRAGLTSVQEITMSFANVQQVVVSQGPLQRLLGLADVRVQSAGGGGDEHESGGGNALHTGVFHGVDNANEIRDLILERLRLFRQAGLGDPDDALPALAPGAVTAASQPTMAAAHELLQEARALRRVISEGAPPEVR